MFARFLFAAALLSSLAHCTRSSPTTPKNASEAANPNENVRLSELGRFSMAMPVSWQVERPLGSEIYSDARGAPGYVTPLTVQVRETTELDEALEMLMARFAHAHAFARHRIEPRIIDSEPALTYLISFDYMEHTHWQVGALIAHAGRTVAIFLSAPDSELINGMRVFDRALATLHFDTTDALATATLKKEG